MKRLEDNTEEEEEGLRLRGGLVFKADRLSYHSTLGLRVIRAKDLKWALGQRGTRVIDASADSSARAHSCLRANGLISHIVSVNYFRKSTPSQNRQLIV